MTFNPDALVPPEDLLNRIVNDVGCNEAGIAHYFTRWGANQAVQALRHQWPDPITDRPPTKDDADDLGNVQGCYGGGWVLRNWETAAKLGVRWLHTPEWRPKPEPTPKEQALALLKIAASDDFVAGGFSPDGIELLIRVVQSAPDTTP